MDDCQGEELIDIPLEFRAKHYDILIVSSEADAEKANKLKEILKRFVDINRNGESIPVEVGTIYDSEDFDEINQIYERIDFALSRSTYYFILLTDSSPEDDIHTMMSHTAINESLNDPRKRYCIVPVYDDSFRSTSKLKYLKCFIGIELKRLVKNQSFDEVEVDSLQEASINPNCLKQLKKLVRSKYEQRKIRENETREEYENHLVKQRREIEKMRLRRENKMEVDRLLHQKQLESIRLRSEEALKDIADTPCDSGLGDSLNEDFLQLKLEGSPKIVTSSSCDLRATGRQRVARPACSSPPHQITINVYNTLPHDSTVTTDAINNDNDVNFVLSEEEDSEEIALHQIAVVAANNSPLNENHDVLMQEQSCSPRKKPQAMVAPVIRTRDSENQHVDNSSEQTYVKQFDNSRIGVFFRPPLARNFPTHGSGTSSENAELRPLVPVEMQPEVPRETPDENINEDETELKHL